LIWGLWLKSTQYLRIKEKNRKYRKLPHVKARNNLRNRVVDILKGRDRKILQFPSRSTPYDTQELRAHLEKQFKSGMTWENYGKVWEIDHIKPISKFDLSILEERIKANALSNLQPMLAEENNKKGAKYESIQAM
jgi:5-methylcytosine-specific restriction endonuclease McrA